MFEHKPASKIFFIKITGAGFSPLSNDLMRSKLMCMRCITLLLRDSCVLPRRLSVQAEERSKENCKEVYHTNMSQQHTKLYPNELKTL